MTEPSCLFFEHALLPAGWARDVRVGIAGDGLIAQVQCGVEAVGARHALGIPGLANAHSHAFQRAMAGLAEHSPAGAADSFWGWRETMYRFVERLEPRHVEAIATLAYTQMLESGFTRVAEFHYLHHDPRGRRYADAGEMCAALIAAAHASGIGLTLGLCPITEANLGDGVFPAVAYAAEGGRLAVGTDSNVHISAAQELALLEYGQRLTLRRRNCLGGASGSPGRGLLALALRGGAQACGIAGGRIETGARADLVALDAAHPSLCAQQQDGWLDGWIFAAGDAAVSAVWVGGQQVVHGGRHPLAARARERYRDCLRGLQA